MEYHTYASAGVDIHKAEAFVERLKLSSKRSGHEVLWPGAGGYASVYPVSESQGVAVTTDGVGTKLLVACQLNRHDTIGVDLVAMCANDLVCVGAKPVAFLDYYGVGKLEDAQADALIAGVIAGCDQAGMLLVGGETAEMPDLYAQGHYDLAGFAVGLVGRERLLTGDSIKPGHTVIGLASSGIHSNGLSLARKILADNADMYEKLITPTLIYAKAVTELSGFIGPAITGVAHITGGGWRNILRLNAGVGYHIDNPLPVLPIFQEIGKTIAEDEMYRTFNMGMGMVVIVGGFASKALDVLSSAGFTVQKIGYVTDKAGTLTIKDSSVVLTREAMPGVAPAS